MITAEETELLRGSRTIAVVGLSKDPSKESYGVSEYMMGSGYEIIPVNPTASEILGRRAYPTLLEIPDEKARLIDIVDVFRPSEDVLPIVEQAVQLRRRYKSHPKMVWMQLGIENERAADIARRAGMIVVQNHCVRTEHRRLAHALQRSR